MSWHPSSHPRASCTPVELPCTLGFPKFGLQCHEVARTGRHKSEVDTWQKHGQRYIRLCYKQAKVRFHTLRTSELKVREFSYALLEH